MKNSNLKIHRQDWKAQTRFLIVAEHGSVILEIFPNPVREGIKALIWSLWVDADYRREGIAAKLLQAAEGLAQSMGEPAVWLEWDFADSPHWVLQWYLRNGYDEVAFGKDISLLKKTFNNEPKRRMI